MSVSDTTHSDIALYLKHSWKLVVAFACSIGLAAGLLGFFFLPELWVAQCTIVPDKSQPAFSGSAALSLLNNPDLAQPAAIFSSRSSQELVAKVLQTPFDEVPKYYSVSMNSTSGILDVRVSHKDKTLAHSAVSELLVAARDIATRKIVSQLQLELSHAERKLAELSDEHAQLNIKVLRAQSSENGAITVEEAKAALSSAEALKLELIATQLQLEREQQKRPASIEASSSPEVVKLKDQLLVLRSELTKSLVTYGEEHPDIKRMRSQIASIESLLALAIEQESKARQALDSSTVFDLASKQASLLARISRLTSRVADQLPNSYDTVRDMAKADAVLLDIQNTRASILLLQSQIANPRLSWSVLDPPKVLPEPERMSPILIGFVCSLLTVIVTVWIGVKGNRLKNHPEVLT